MRHYASFHCTHPFFRHTPTHARTPPPPRELYFKANPLDELCFLIVTPYPNHRKVQNIFFFAPPPQKIETKRTLTLDVNTPNRFYNVFSHIAAPIAFRVRNCLSGSACMISVTTAFVTSCSRVALLVFRTHRFRLYLGVTSSWERRGSFPDLKKTWSF